MSISLADNYELAFTSYTENVKSHTTNAICHAAQSTHMHEFVTTSNGYNGIIDKQSDEVESLKYLNVGDIEVGFDQCVFMINSKSSKSLQPLKQLICKIITDFVLTSITEYEL